MKIIEKYYKKKAKRSLLNRFRYELEVEKLMEKWIVKRILEGQKGRRKELIEKRKRIEEVERLLKFLKTQ